MNFNLITVKIADLKVATSPDILRTVLGSCIGICLYDTEKRIGGLSHIMLPSSDDENPRKEKYADTAIPLLIEEMEKAGADRSRLTAKIVGGATMFKISMESMIGNIGNRNINIVRKILKEIKIKIIAEEVGADYARTIDFYLDTGMIKIKLPNKIITII
ncbi:MAG: chemotaxis protein CheD [Spirochaetes bacterium]|nr:chemotaxis protein CheD [Spirochaetota bacterium]